MAVLSFIGLMFIYWQIIDTFQAYVDGLNTCRRLKREQDII